MTSSDLPLPQQLARLTARSPTAVALIVANLIPIWGVFFAGWDVGTILAIYWLENVAIGLLNVAKILTAQGGGAANPTKFFLAPFFCVHYGIFTLVHGAFVFGVFQKGGPFGGGGGFGGFGGGGPFAGAIEAIGTLMLPFVGFLLSHLFSYFYNFIGRGEYKMKSPPEMMAAPYGRVVVLHVTIIFGGFITMALGSPKPVIFLLVIFKTIGDTFFHLKEHNKIAELTVEKGVS